MPAGLALGARTPLSGTTEGRFMPPVSAAAVPAVAPAAPAAAKTVRAAAVRILFMSVVTRSTRIRLRAGPATDGGAARFPMMRT